MASDPHNGGPTPAKEEDVETKAKKGYLLDAAANKTEAARLDMQHVTLTKILDDKLYIAPLGDSVRSVLDLGTGSGIWAIDFANAHPEADVLGVDITKAIPEQVPKNFRFETMNIAQPWTVDEKFDFIHSRLLFSVQLDVAELARQVFAHLKPGGWWEAFELRFPPTSPDGTGARSQMERWIQVTLEATTALGQNWTIWEPLADYMRNAGFVDVQEQRRILELGAWGRDPSPNDPGTMYETEVMGRFARMWHLLLGKGLGWKKEDIDQLAEDRHREAMEGKVHYIIECVIMTGRRPE